jgi:hypothetical protein
MLAGRLRVGNESLHKISNDNGVRVVTFATPENLRVKSMTFPQRNNHKFIWKSPYGKPRNQIDHILVGMQRHLNVLGVQSFRTTDCDTKHYLVVANVRERLAVNKQRAHKFHMERFTCFVVLDRFVASEDLDAEVEINSAWEIITESIKNFRQRAARLFRIEKA